MYTLHHIFNRLCASNKLVNAEATGTSGVEISPPRLQRLTSSSVARVRDQDRLLYEGKIEFEALVVLRLHLSEVVPRASSQGVHQQLVLQLRSCGRGNCARYPENIVTAFWRVCCTLLTTPPAASRNLKTRTYWIHAFQLQHNPSTAGD